MPISKTPGCSVPATDRGIARTGATRGLAALGFSALSIGILVYVTDRDASHAVLIPAVAALSGSHLFGVLGQWLPSFVHPFAFSLFTAAAQPAQSRPAYGACLAWWAVNVAFEVAQYPGFSADVADALQRAAGPAWLTNAVSNYLLQGTFDVADLAAATGGALAAALLLHLMHLRETRDAH
jgi:hypothetical protein